MKYVKLTAKPDTWFKAGTEAFSDDENRRLTSEEWKDWSKWNMVLLCGLRECEDNDNERGNGWKAGDLRWDAECCGCDEFEVEFVEDNGEKEYKELEKQG